MIFVRRFPLGAMGFFRTATLLFLSASIGIAASSVGVGATKNAAPAKAAASPVARTRISPAALSEFTSVCLHAYQVSSGNAVNAAKAGKFLCECTAKESPIQGVIENSLRSETAQIRKNPKYQFRDKHLLDSMRICFIDAYRHK